MSLCETCQAELPEPKASNALMASVIITELERAINTTPERRAALVAAKAENLRQTLLMVWEQAR